jgi:hypothetical protein
MQRSLLTCPHFEVLAGGSRGGGKTDGVLGEWLVHSQRYGADAVGLMVRRHRTELVETVERARQMFLPLGAKVYDSNPPYVVMENGARLRFGYLDRDADADAYQGWSLTRVYFEELGTFPTIDPYRKLMATLRSGAGVPVGMRATGNPGGVGQPWVRARFIDPAPAGWTTIVEGGRSRIFLPSRVSDNPFLGEDYVAQLRLVGSPELVRAWLDGDWDAVAGQFFSEFRSARHVMTECRLPREWARYRAMDWGFAAPFCVLWFAVSDGSVPAIPRGALVVYREWYGCASPNVGLRLTAEEVAAGIVERERWDDVRWGVLDPAAFASDGGPSIGERLNRALAAAAGGKQQARHPPFRPADNRRVGGVGALSGWDQVRARLRGDGERPALYISQQCVHLIRTMPMMQHDRARLEDMDTDGEDHAVDALRYGVMARPYVARQDIRQSCRTEYTLLARGGKTGITFGDLVKLSEAQTRERRP